MITKRIDKVKYASISILEENNSEVPTVAHFDVRLKQSTDKDNRYYSDRVMIEDGIEEVPLRHVALKFVSAIRKDIGNKNFSLNMD